MTLVLGIALPAIWIVCWMYGTRLWFDYQYRHYLEDPSWRSKPGGVELFATLFFTLLAPPVVLAIVWFANSRTEKNGWGWFTPCLARIEQEKARKKELLAEAASIRISAYLVESGPVRDSLLTAASSLESEARS